MKRIKNGFTVMTAAILASCASTGQVYAQAAEEVATYEFNYTIDLIPVILYGVGAYLIYRGIRYFINRDNENVAQGIVTKGDLCGSNLSISDSGVDIKLRGNGNCYIKGVTINGVRMPDVEILDKILYIDGVKKRNLSNNCHIYNRGKGIFVDGKYVA